MARTIEATPEQLEAAAAKIESAAGDYKSQCNALYGETDMMSSAWSGADNLAFTNQIAGFRDDLAQMYSLMTAYADFLRKSAKAYRQVQSEAVAEARKLGNSVGSAPANSKSSPGGGNGSFGGGSGGGGFRGSDDASAPVTAQEKANAYTAGGGGYSSGGGGGGSFGGGGGGGGFR